jgi:hypothetical protein
MPPELAGPYVPGMIIFVVSSFVTVSCAWDLIDGLRSRGWPTVRGRILGHGFSLGATKHPGDDSVVFAYEYTVGGVEYRGARFDYAGRNRVAESAELMETYFPGRRVMVHYDPKRPDRAVLQPGIGVWTVFPLLVSSVVTLVTGLISYAAITILLSR